MREQHARYSAGKQTERDTWEYLRELGFVRPTPLQRKTLVRAFASRQIEIHPSGFDVVEARHLADLDSLDRLIPVLDDITMYEVKTAGKERRAQVTPGFRGLGFTLTSKELHNANALGGRYRFIFVNLRTGTHALCALSDFFCEEVARIYPTWSVFIARDLVQVRDNQAAETPVGSGSVNPPP